MSEDLTLVSKEINQRPQKILDHSDYRYLRIVQQNGGNTLDLDANGGQETVFQIPASQVFNFSRSLLVFGETQTTDVTAAKFVYRFSDCIPHIRRITVSTQKGQVILCDIPDVHKYTNATLRYETRLDEMSGNDSPLNLNATPGGVFEGLIPPLSDTEFAVRNSNSEVVRNKLLEPIYYIKNDVAQKTLTIYNRLSLSLFKNTILAMDKNRFFGDVIEIRITWNPNSCVYYEAEATTIDKAIAPSKTLNIFALEFLLCTENNVEIVKDMKTRFTNQGFVDHVPFLYHSKQLKTGSLQHIQIDVNRSQGSHLLKILWFPSNVYEDLFNRYRHSNLGHIAAAAGTIANTTNIIDFNPLINGNPIYSSSVKCPLNEPYVYQKQRLKGSCITSVDDYNHNFTWYQDWTDPNPLWMKQSNKFDPDVYIDGYPLTEPVKYEIDINFGAATATRNHYLYAVLLRKLTVNTNEISLT